MIRDTTQSYLRTIREVFDAHGVSIAEWARLSGFSVPLVYQVLSGRKKCVRGQSHAIAVALGLKNGHQPDAKQVGKIIRKMAEEKSKAAGEGDTKPLLDSPPTAEGGEPPG